MWQNSGKSKKVQAKATHAEMSEVGDYILSAFAVDVGIRPSGKKFESYVCKPNDPNKVGRLFGVPAHYAWQNDGMVGLSPLERAKKDSPNPPINWAIGAWLFREDLQRGNTGWVFHPTTYQFVGMDQSTTSPGFSVAGPAIGGVHGDETREIVQGVVTQAWGYTRISELPDRRISVDAESLEEVLEELRGLRYQVQSGGLTQKRGVKVMKGGREVSIAAPDRPARRGIGTGATSTDAQKAQEAKLLALLGDVREISKMA